MRVIVVGSRSISDPNAIELAILESGFPITEVLTGDSSGVDALVQQWAMKQDKPLKVIAVDWRLHGGQADTIRNEQLVGNADACIMVWDGFSRGTRHLRDLVYLRGLKFCLYQCNPQRVTDRSTTTIYRSGT
jgi:hypothetical protein